jgi:exosortase A
MASFRALTTPSNRRHAAAFAALAVVLLAVLAPEAADMVRQWTWSSSYHHGWLAAPIALFLVLEARDWRAVPFRFDAGGAAILIAALALTLAGRAIEAAIVGHASVVAGFVGAAVMTLGRAFVRRSAFAFSFLIFMIPFGESLIPPLQAAAAGAVASLLNFSGVETHREGVLLTTGAGRFELAESCAGLRYLLAAAMIAALAAHLAFRGWRRKALFVAAAIALAIAANWLRAYVIVLAATLSDMAIGTGPEHVAFGWFFYIGLTLALLAIARRIGDRNRAPALASMAAPVE